MTGQIYEDTGIITTKTQSTTQDKGKPKYPQQKKKT
jgi:hypothetical protein